MYYAACAGHVDVMSVVYEWCGEGCLYWAKPVTGSYPPHTAADCGHCEALVWLLSHQRLAAAKRLWCEEASKQVERECSEYLCEAVGEVSRAMEAYLGCEAAMARAAQQWGHGYAYV